MNGLRDKIETLKKTRAIAADALADVLEEWNKTDPMSELDLRDSWLTKIRGSEMVFDDGWYIPPPHGMGILFGKDGEFERVNYKTFREEEFWPKEVLLDSQSGMIIVYASPVNIEAGIIGDFGLSIYLGKDPKVIDHLKRTYQSVNEIFIGIQVGMKLSDVANLGKKVMEKYGISSDLVSMSDPVGTNIGHTIPFLNEEWSNEEREAFNNAEDNWEVFKDVLSKKRIFVNSAENQEIKPGMAFTIEPRPLNPNDKRIPMVYFHSIVVIDENGNKELITGFDKIFNFAGMNYLLK